jgi:hypothetical protein
MKNYGIVLLALVTVSNAMKKEEAEIQGVFNKTDKNIQCIVIGDQFPIKERIDDQIIQPCNKCVLKYKELIQSLKKEVFVSTPVGSYTISEYSTFVGLAKYFYDTKKKFVYEMLPSDKYHVIVESDGIVTLEKILPKIGNEYKKQSDMDVTKILDINSCVIKDEEPHTASINTTNTLKIENISELQGIYNKTNKNTQCIVFGKQRGRQLEEFIATLNLTSGKEYTFNYIKSLQILKKKIFFSTDAGAFTLSESEDDDNVSLIKHFWEQKKDEVQTISLKNKYRAIINPDGNVELAAL